MCVFPPTHSPLHRELLSVIAPSSSPLLPQKPTDTYIVYNAAAAAAAAAADNDNNHDDNDDK